MEEYKVLITTSGVGSRLGNLTKYTNKSLVRIGKKPTLSYIVEKYPDEIELVITLGYYGNQVRDFLTLAYPNKNFNFVEVDNYKGKGSSLGYSLLCARKELQCPFIYHASDTIVSSTIPPPSFNWMGICKKENHSEYATVDINTFRIHDKGYLGSTLAYIGLTGINNYSDFWEELEKEYNKNPNDITLNDCNSLNNIINSDWEIINFNEWLDIGNAASLKISRKKIEDKFKVLDKVDESVFIFDDFVIKFFYNKEICSNRVKRGKMLNGLAPKVLDSRENFYKYKLAEGDLLSSVIDVPLFDNFLEWSLNNLWIKGEKDQSFKETSKTFYIDKTINRIEKFYKNNNLEDSLDNINGYNVPSVKEMLKEIDLNWLCTDTPYKFHGDYILDNIILEDNYNFKLIDWRQDFGGEIKKGDREITGQGVDTVLKVQEMASMNQILVTDLLRSLVYGLEIKFEENKKRINSYV